MSPIRRRSFIRCAAGAAVVAAVSGCADRLPKDPASVHLPILDTHTHFYDPARPAGVPWPPKDDALLHRRVLPDEYRSMTAPLGVTGTLVVEASAWESDNQWVLDLMQRESFLVGLVGHLTPGSPGFEAKLRRLAANPRFRGIRTGTWTTALDVATGSQTRSDLKAMADLGLSLDVLAGTESLPKVAAIAAELPSLTLIINHVGGVRIDGNPPPPDWLKGMQACARHPRVSCKISGLVEGTGRADGRAPADTSYYLPVLESIRSAFGEERMLYGSNWPVSARFAPYPTVQEIARDYAMSLGTRAARGILAGNARRVYRLPG